jgi:cyclic pyranopterin phosphate synthase
MVKDRFGRQFKKLRVSLTSQCNFSCLYCTGVHHEQKPKVVAPVSPLLPQSVTQQIIANIGHIHQQVQLQSVRLTGGEPLLNPDVTTIVAAVRKMGIDDIRLTTNGFLLPQYAQRLVDAGLQSANVSLDAISPEVFRAMSRRGGLAQVLKGIEKALEVGLDVKINTVLMRNRNDGEILPLLDYASQMGIIIRYLELMSMGPLHQTAHLWLVSQGEILQTIQKQHATIPIPRKDNSTAKYWQTTNGQVFGIIANESEPFCADCDRLRLEPGGKIYGCISAPVGIQLTSNNTTQALQLAIKQKQEVKFSGSHISMLQMGG